MLTRICPSCGARVRAGTRCECKGSRYREYDNEHRDKEKSRIYYSSQWKALAEYARSRAGYKDEYLAMYHGRLERGSVVHHIIPLDDNMGAAYDDSNLVCVSQRTHRMIHDAYRESAERKLGMQKQLMRIREGGG